MSGICLRLIRLFDDCVTRKESFVGDACVAREALVPSHGLAAGPSLPYLPE